MFNKMMLAAGFAMAFAMVATTSFAGMYDESKSDSQHGMHDHKMEKMDNESEEGFAAWDKMDEEPMSVQVDIKPEDEANRLSANETFQVALLGTEDFDVNNVDQSSLTLGDAKGNGNFRIADSNNDGIDDLIAEFSAEELQMDQGTRDLTLKGKTKDGKSFEGSDKVTFASAEF